LKGGIISRSVGDLPGLVRRIRFVQLTILDCAIACLRKGVRTRGSRRENSIGLLQCRPRTVSPPQRLASRGRGLGRGPLWRSYSASGASGQYSFVLMRAGKSRKRPFRLGAGGWFQVVIFRGQAARRALRGSALDSSFLAVAGSFPRQAATISFRLGRVHKAVGLALGRVGSFFLEFSDRNQRRDYSPGPWRQNKTRGLIPGIPGSERERIFVLRARPRIASVESARRTHGGEVEAALFELETRAIARVPLMPD